MITISNDFVSQIGLYVVLPAFIGLLVFIALDVAKRSGMGRFGMAMAMMVLGAGIFVFIIKMVLELVFKYFLV